MTEFVQDGGVGLHLRHLAFYADHFRHLRPSGKPCSYLTTLARILVAALVAPR